MNKLLSVLIVFAFATVPAFAADAPKPTEAAKPAAAAVAPAAALAAGKPSVAGELVTPQSDAAALKDFIAQRKTASDAAKAKAAEGKK